MYYDPAITYHNLKLLVTTATNMLGKVKIKSKM